jgi:hypothetical protein
MRLLVALTLAAVFTLPLLVQAKNGGGGGSSMGHGSPGSAGKATTSAPSSHISVSRGDSGSNKVAAAPKKPTARVDGESTNGKHEREVDIEEPSTLKAPPPPPPKQ